MPSARPFSCTPKKKAEKEGRRSSASGAAFPRIAPGVETEASALWTFGAFLGGGAGRNRAEKPLQPRSEGGGRRQTGDPVRAKVAPITPPLRGSRQARRAGGGIAEAKRERQPDGRIRFWGQVSRPGEGALRILRVVTLDDGETIHNAFFDRGFRKERP